VGSPQPAGGALKSRRGTRPRSEPRRQERILRRRRRSGAPISVGWWATRNLPETLQLKTIERIGDATRASAIVIFSTHSARTIGPGLGCRTKPACREWRRKTPRTRRRSFPRRRLRCAIGPLRRLWRIVLRSGSRIVVQNQHCCGVAARRGKAEGRLTRSAAPASSRRWFRLLRWTL